MNDNIENMISSPKDNSKTKDKGKQGKIEPVRARPDMVSNDANGLGRSRPKIEQSIIKKYKEPKIKRTKTITPTTEIDVVCEFCHKPGTVIANEITMSEAYVHLCKRCIKK